MTSQPSMDPTATGLANGRFGRVVRHLEFDQFPEQHLVVIAQKSPE